jgi:trimeric autotransporter adhesin
MKNKLHGSLLVLVMLALSGLNFELSTAHAQSTAFTYQGLVTDNGANFTGTGQFQFALVTSTNTSVQATATANMGGSSPHEFVETFNLTSGGSGYVNPPAVTITGGGGSGASAEATISGGAVTSLSIISPGSGYISTPTVTIGAPSADITYVTYWSNDGTSTAGSEPTNAISINVSDGLFTVALGDTTLANMMAIPASVFTEQSNLQLRIWFNDGVNGFAALSPVQNLTPMPYAITALSANTSSNLSGTVNVGQLNGTLGNSRLAHSSITLTAGTGLSGGGTVALGGSTTLTNAGVLSVTGNADITATSVGGAVTLGDTATSSDSADTIVKRDASGNFAAGTITATSFSGAFNGDGAGLTNLNVSAAQLTSIGNTGGGSGNFFVGPSGNSTMNGYYNTAIGFDALNFDTTGNQNSAVGADALHFDTSGAYNAANGFSALYLNTNGSYNMADGAYALEVCSSGSNNVALGYAALQSIATGSGNIAIETRAGTALASGNDNIDIDNAGFGDESDTIRIGTSQTKAVMAGIYNGNIASSSGLVCVDPSGLLSSVPAGGAVLSGNLEIGTSPADYRQLEMGGGNSQGFLYGSYPAFGDGIHLGYNYYADAAGNDHIINAGGATSRITVTYGAIVLADSGGVANAAPTVERLVANATGVIVNGTFNNNSDRNAKKNFASVSPSDLLDKVLRLPISEWSYKTDPATRHIGPMAQDFYSVFNIGTDEKHIAPIDEGGVALAAIQGLNQKLQETQQAVKAKDGEIQSLQQQNGLLAERLNELETTVRELAARK